MDTVICGDGRLGRAIAGALTERGSPVRMVGRPPDGHHAATSFQGADVVVDASRGGSVAGNVDAALEGGIRRLLIATTGWDADRERVERLVGDAAATAVVAPNLSLGAAVFLRIVERAAGAFGRLPDYEPFVWEWHRRGKADRPSGTAREIVRRMARAWPAAGESEVVAVRAGASPGVHVVGFDAPGETIELRLTARDRSAYAAGALVAIDWLRDASASGVHPFDDTVDSLIDRSLAAAVAA